MSKKLVFIVSCTLVYGVALLGKFRYLPLPSFIVANLADFLCLPLMLSFSLLLIRKIKNEPGLNLSPAMIGAVFLYISVVFEWLLPMYSSKYTRDLLDVLAYGAGGVCWGIIQKRIFGI
ncbi:MAG: hypothetical protein V4616_06000 [Bacteroidota bacterium]